MHAPGLASTVAVFYTLFNFVFPPSTAGGKCARAPWVASPAVRARARKKLFIFCLKTMSSSDESGPCIFETEIAHDAATIGA